MNMAASFVSDVPESLDAFGFHIAIGDCLDHCINPVTKCFVFVTQSSLFVCICVHLWGCMCVIFTGHTYSDFIITVLYVVLMWKET